MIKYKTYFRDQPFQKYDLYGLKVLNCKEKQGMGSHVQIGGREKRG